MQLYPILSYSVFQTNANYENNPGNGLYYVTTKKKLRTIKYPDDLV